MKKSGYLIIGALLLFLFFTNPGKEDFKEYLKAKAYEQADSKIEKVFVGLVEGLFGAASEMFVRKDYYIFSTYTFDDTVFLGIAGKFIPLKEGNIKESMMKEENLHLFKNSESFKAMEKEIKEQADKMMKELEDALQSEESE